MDGWKGRSDGGLMGDGFLGLGKEEEDGGERGRERLDGILCGSKCV